LREHVGRFGMLQVERDAFLRAIRPHEVRREPVGAFVVGTREVAAAGPLHLDDARAQVGQLARAERRRDRVLEGDDGDAFQGFHAQNDFGSPSTCSAT
jgi:hypothetical protein